MPFDKLFEKQVAYKLSFDGGQANGEAIPSAGKNGTLIHVKDLFHNMNMRQKSYNPNEEQFKESRKYY